MALFFPTRFNRRSNYLLELINEDTKEEASKVTHFRRLFNITLSHFFREVLFEDAVSCFSDSVEDLLGARRLIVERCRCIHPLLYGTVQLLQRQV